MPIVAMYHAECDRCERGLATTYDNVAELMVHLSGKEWRFTRTVVGTAVDSLLLCSECRAKSAKMKAGGGA